MSPRLATATPAVVTPATARSANGAASYAVPPISPRPPTPLASRLAGALADPTGALLNPLTNAVSADRRDRALTLLIVYDLHTAPLDDVGAAARHQHHPAVAAVKQRLEAAWLAELDAAWAAQDRFLADWPDQIDPQARGVADLRALAAADRLPTAYRWLARAATWPQLVRFLALEGGPDGGFDDLVARCQVGLSGSAKLELAKNYWDEMGRGHADGVHTVLHQRMAAALGLPAVRREQAPVEALERAAIGGLLATNRWLQPEMLGALGLLELQAGPRCRLVVQAFDRLGAPAEAYPFYTEHAEMDPVHGRDWLDKAVVPVVTARPDWGPRIVRGAWWRDQLNLAFFPVAQQVARQGVPHLPGPADGQGRDDPERTS